MSMKLHKSCQTLSIHNFHRILETENFKFLIIGYDEYNDDVDLTEKEQYKLIEIFNSIAGEYSDLTLNTKTTSNYNKRILIEYLEFQYSMSIKIVDLYNESGSFEVVGLLREFGYTINEKNTASQVQTVINKLKGLKNQIRIHKINYDKKNKPTEDTRKVNLEKEALNIEAILDLKYNLNPMNTSVSRWIALAARCEDVIRMRKKLKNG